MIRVLDLTKKADVVLFALSLLAFHFLISLCLLKVHTCYRRVPPTPPESNANEQTSKRECNFIFSLNLPVKIIVTVGFFFLLPSSFPRNNLRERHTARAQRMPENPGEKNNTISDQKTAHNIEHTTLNVLYSVLSTKQCKTL